MGKAMFKKTFILGVELRALVIPVAALVSKRREYLASRALSNLLGRKIGGVELFSIFLHLPDVSLFLSINFAQNAILVRENE